MDNCPTIYAIDFGTSNSLLAAASARRVFDPVPLDPEHTDPTILRSVLYFAPDGSSVLGAAGLHAYTEAGLQGRLLRSLKRFLPNPAFTHTTVGTRRFRLEELIAALLRAMRERADAHFGTRVTRVLLGRPALYSIVPEEDRIAEARMREAALLAGFEDVHFCPEPVAAARDFGDSFATPQLTLVADFGGGTSDFCLVRMSSQGFASTDVLSVRGVPTAGDALDGALMRRELSGLFGADVSYRVPLGSNVLSMPAVLLDMLCTPAKLSLLSTRDVQRFLQDIKHWSLTDEDELAVGRLLIVAEDGVGFSVYEAVEQTKRELSGSEAAPFQLTYPGLELSRPVTRRAFETATQPPIREIFECLDVTLQNGGVTAADVDWICLTGGTSLVPAVQDALRTRFGDAKLRRLKGFHSVVGGLAQQARLLVAN